MRIIRNEPIEGFLILSLPCRSVSAMKAFVAKVAHRAAELASEAVRRHRRTKKNEGEEKEG